LKTLYLLRHAKALPAGRLEIDVERKLAERGREACVVIADYMQKKNYLPEFILSSYATRTKETIEIIKQNFAALPQCEFDKSIYMASSEDVLHKIQEIDDNFASALIVGHNPTMHHLALTLSSPDMNDSKEELLLKYPTGSLTVLKFVANSWHDITQGGGKLLDFKSPDQA